RLAKSGVGLRIRRDGRQWIQTVKGPPEAESGGGLAARPEYEWAIGRSSRMPSIDTTRLATTPWQRVLLQAARRGLAPVFVTDLPLSLEPASKAARGVRLVSSVPPAPVRAENAQFSRDATAGDVLGAIIRVCLRQVEGNAEGIVHDDDPEWIHQMRIGTRRLRA